jgi:hypothetical protein
VAAAEEAAAAAGVAGAAAGAEVSPSKRRRAAADQQQEGSAAGEVLWLCMCAAPAAAWSSSRNCLSRTWQQNRANQLRRVVDKYLEAHLNHAVL